MKLWKLGADASILEVLTWCVKERAADRMLLATRIDTDAKARTLLEPRVDQTVAQLFGPSVRRIAWATAWPVTKLIGHPGKVYVVDLNADVVTKMSGVQDRLFGWTQWNDPPLPEDACAFRVGDALPALASVTHERDAWLLHDADPNVGGARETAWEEDLVNYIPQRPDFLEEATQGAAITR